MRNVMSWINFALKVLMPFFIVILGLEFGARFLLGHTVAPQRNFTGYTEEEKDRNIPFIADQNGARCISLKGGFNWNQWWGYSAKDLDIDCAKDFFSADTYNVVFMGGSAMFNAEAPNYLTTLEYYATNGIDKLRSINLAESGARHMNMSVRFQREVIPLKPNLVIFFDGYNEFSSILYNGSPYDDYYWTATGKVRMHSHYKLYIDKAIELSSFLELALVHTGVYESTRNVRNVDYNISSVNKAASAYLRDISVTSALCESFNIKCLFIIQPQVYSSSLSEHKAIISVTAERFPLAETVQTEGYRRILEGCNDCIDMSSVLNDLPRSFLDPVHFGKDGSERLGNLFRKLILDDMNKQ